MDWEGRRVIVIGAARQGAALARYLSSHGADVVLSDQRKAEDLASVQSELQDIDLHWELGGHPLSLLDNADLVCPSGGVPLSIPLVAEAMQRDIPLSNEAQIFMQAVPATVIGITGSAGKTTTTSLVGRIAEHALNTGGPYRKIWVGGNIGNPLIAHIDEMKTEDLVVIELSSFQLELMTTSPQIAVILNITPNHLDRHHSMEAYSAAKFNILKHQSSSQDIAVLNRDDSITWALKDNLKGELYSFGLTELPEGFFGTFVAKDDIWLRTADKDEKIMPVSGIQLRGEHNLLNVLAACAIVASIGLPIESMEKGVAEFEGVEHRLEYVRSWGGAHWYNDSIATAPERAIASIKAFDEPLILLAGGRDKDLPWDEFISVVQEKVDHLILFGEARDLINDSFGPIKSGRLPKSISTYQGLESAVQAAAKLVKPGSVVILAPGGTSFDEFEDFAIRGEKYKEWVMAL